MPQSRTAPPATYSETPEPHRFLTRVNGTVPSYHGEIYLLESSKGRVAGLNETALVRSNLGGGRALISSGTVSGIEQVQFSLKAIRQGSFFQPLVFSCTAISN